MSDRSAWLDQWCPECGASTGSRCQRWHWGRRGSASRAAPLGELRNAGILTDAEFDSKKAELLDRL
jgi:Short C-terminal domain